jgi:hypothetical protein
MFPVNKDIMIMISVACALIAIFYLYKDQQKTKNDLQKLTDSQVAPIIPVPVKKPAPPTPSPDADVSKE